MHLAMRPTPCTTRQVHLLVFFYYLLLLFYLLYKAEMTSVRLSVGRHAHNSVVYAGIDVGLGICRAVVFGM